MRPSLISFAASRMSASSSTVTMERVMISRTRQVSGSSSAATHRVTISRSVRMPRSRPSDVITGSEPML